MNMITDAGIDDIGKTFIAANYTKIKVGSGGDAPSSADIELDAFVAEKTVTPSVIGNILTWDISFTGTELGSEGISELGIFNTSGDKMLSRVTFSNTGVLASTDTLTFTIRMEVR
tara:strand:- start:141 stop:485 length:345 start_codon:yes stop_codon:yes gene_type:complete